MFMKLNNSKTHNFLTFSLHFLYTIYIFYFSFTYFPPLSDVWVLVLMSASHAPPSFLLTSQHITSHHITAHITHHKLCITHHASHITHRSHHITHHTLNITHHTSHHTHITCSHHTSHIIPDHLRSTQTRSKSCIFI